MKKYVVLIILLILLFPVTIHAKERLEIYCNKNELNSNEEIECKILANDLSFIVTGISAKLKISSNIDIVSSKYDDKKWKMLDDEFDVKDINLINEKPIKENTIEIATFTIKSSSNKKLKENIVLEDLIIGDQNYEKRKIDIKNVTIYINKNNRNYILYISLITMLIILSIIKVNRGAV